MGDTATGLAVWFLFFGVFFFKLFKPVALPNVKWIGRRTVVPAQALGHVTFSGQVNGWSHYVWSVVMTRGVMIAADARKRMNE